MRSPERRTQQRFVAFVVGPARYRPTVENASVDRGVQKVVPAQRMAHGLLRRSRALSARRCDCRHVRPSIRQPPPVGNLAELFDVDGWTMLAAPSPAPCAERTAADKSLGLVQRLSPRPLRGYHFLHTALDGHSRLAYSELLSDETKDTAAEFWRRAHAWFAECGIIVRKVLTDNGSCYRSRTFAEALGAIEHRRTRPYRPQTNGKVERFHRTLTDEWAYARLYRSDAERCEQFTTWLHAYNHHRGHTALGGQPPASRT